MKKIIFCLFILFQSLCGFAGHIAGGEVYYKYLGPGAASNTSRYEISLRLFRECAAAGSNTSAMPTSVVLGIYTNASPSSQVGSQVTVSRTNFSSISLIPGPCVSPAPNPPICYEVGTFTFQQELANTAAGYIVTFQTCCRTIDIKNMQGESFLVGGTQPFVGDGATYTGQIPGTDALPTGNNSSPVFALKDTTLVCLNSPFTLDFSASDPDAGDSLSYSFCAAYNRGLTSSANDNNYSAPPYNPIGYLPGFSGSSPLGTGVTINPRTGIISGIAPNEAGRYVVTVCITEWRNGKVISNHRKDFTLRVETCTLTGAVLKPSYITCDGFTLTFENQSTSANITSYLWDFGEKNVASPTSTLPTPSHTYKDTGVYTLKLKVTSSGGCQDSTTAPVKIFPGFTTDFNVQGTCFLNNYQFRDATSTAYGVVDSWKWNFGDTTTQADTARARDSAWKYSSARTVNATLITTNSKGCIDTMSKVVTILDRPILNLPFRDTLICSIDTLMLRVNMGNSASVSWTPMNGPNRNRILNANTATPLVFPRDSTKYYVSVNDNGCANSDSVTVNVLQFIAVNISDTGICRTDSFRLRPVSDALSYQWTASTGERVDNIKNPMVRPLVTTQYNVIANLGKCQARDSAIVRSVAYPTAALGPDLTICYGSRVQLNGSVVGSVFSWSPSSSLVNENTLTPTAGPTRTTAYVLTASDTIGCPKPTTDTIIVTVVPMVAAYAGKDTTILPGQPLVMGASGGISYLWRPTTGLNDPTLAEPTAILDNTIDSITYIVRVTAQGGCFAEDDVKVRVYKPGADILVPSAFTPNGDGKNDIIKPTTVGIQKLTYFSIYNRWGQLLFSTPEINKGWDGNFAGQAQPSGTYVYQALGLDYLGNPVYRKGTCVLIR